MLPANGDRQTGERLVVGLVVMLLVTLGVSIGEGYLWTGPQEFLWVVVATQIIAGSFCTLQSFRIGLVSLSVILSIAPTLGFGITAIHSPHLLMLLSIGIGSGLIIGMTGHVIGAEIARQTDSREIGENESWVVAIIYLIGAAFILMEIIPRFVFGQ